MAKEIILAKKYKKRIEMLYQHYLLGETKSETIKKHFEDSLIEDEELDKLEKILDYQTELETKIKELIKLDWRWERINPLEKAILLNASYELIILKLDHAQAISIATEYAKQYIDKNAANFINGVLDNIKN